jgi:drug/metabolite transporter (DMT)-like permease
VQRRRRSRHLLPARRAKPHTLGSVKVVSALLGAILAALLGLIGLFLVVYEGEEGSEGDTWVNLGGTHVDADVVGAPLLVLAVLVIAVSLRALRRKGIP